MFTTVEIAERFGVSYQTVMSWHRSGKLPNAVKESSPRGDYWLVPESDLSGLSKRGRGRPKKAPPTTDATAAGTKKGTAKKGKKAS